MEAKRGVKEAFNCGWERGREGAQRKGRPREIAVVVDKRRRGCSRRSRGGSRKGYRRGLKSSEGKRGEEGLRSDSKPSQKNFSKKTE